ncbi:hypothetical protein SNE40_001786 [Patella caerulea]|uniref:BHLH domain-containing protein n=1 Tax=Patella caerulea TaxID=87958 RepID=A0AAN8KB35_PATCE
MNQVDDNYVDDDEEMPTSCDGITQTDYDEDDPGSEEENMNFNHKQNYLNVNNSRKRVLEELTDYENLPPYKSPKIDRLLFQASCQLNEEDKENYAGHCSKLVSWEGPDETPGEDTKDSRLSDEIVTDETIEAEQDEEVNDDKNTPGVSPRRSEKHVRIVTSSPDCSRTTPTTTYTVLPTSTPYSPDEKNNWYHVYTSVQNKILNGMSLSTPCSESQTTPAIGTAPSGQAICLSGQGTSGGQAICLSGQGSSGGQSLCLSGQGSYVYTPHPKTGQLFYLSAGADGSPQLSLCPPPPFPTPDTVTKSTLERTTPSSPFAQLQPTTLCLNSSGEENLQIPNDHINDTLTLNADNFVCKKPNYELLQSPEVHEEEPRETHNLKERRRRARIKEACDLMRNLIPGMSEKTDKATVFEFAARYIHFLKTYTGSQYDKDFLIKYSPY